MSRELEAVNKWLKEYLILCEKLSTNQQERMLLNNDSPYNILKTYFESIDNVTPSEAMKELDEIIEYITEDKKVKYKATILFDCEIIKDALLKAQKMEKENVYCAGGRNFSKEIIYLKQSIEQCNDKPIYYISRSFGNKYIVPQKIFEEQEKNNARNEEILQKYYQEGITLDSVRALKQERDNYKRVLEIIKEKTVSIFQLSCCKNVNEYNDLKFKDNEKLTQEEFNLLKKDRSE